MAKAPKSPTEIDRLIELASENKSGDLALSGETTHALSVQEKDTKPAMWRILLQLRPLLPYLSRLLPLLESGLLGTGFTRGAAGHALTHDTSHFDQGIAGIESGYRELNTLLKSQAAEIRQLREQVEALTSAAEVESGRREEMAEKIRLMVKSLTNWAIVAVVLLGALMGSVLFLMLNRSN